MDAVYAGLLLVSVLIVAAVIVALLLRMLGLFEVSRRAIGWGAVAAAVLVAVAALLHGVADHAGEPLVPAFVRQHPAPFVIAAAALAVFVLNHAASDR